MADSKQNRVWGCIGALILGSVVGISSCIHGDAPAPDAQNSPSSAVFSSDRVQSPYVPSREAESLAALDGVYDHQGEYDAALTDLAQSYHTTRAHIRDVTMQERSRRGGRVKNLAIMGRVGDYAYMGLKFKNYEAAARSRKKDTVK